MKKNTKKLLLPFVSALTFAAVMISSTTSMYSTIEEIKKPFDLSSWASEPKIRLRTKSEFKKIGNDRIDIVWIPKSLLENPDHKPYLTNFIESYWNKINQSLTKRADPFFFESWLQVKIPNKKLNFGPDKLSTFLDEKGIYTKISKKTGIKTPSSNSVLSPKSGKLQKAFWLDQDGTPVAWYGGPRFVDDLNNPDANRLTPMEKSFNEAIKREISNKKSTTTSREVPSSQQHSVKLNGERKKTTYGQSAAILRKKREEQRLKYPKLQWKPLELTEKVAKDPLYPVHKSGKKVVLSSDFSNKLTTNKAPFKSETQPKSILKKPESTQNLEFKPKKTVKFSSLKDPKLAEKLTPPNKLNQSTPKKNGSVFHGKIDNIKTLNNVKDPDKSYKNHIHKKMEQKVKNEIKQTKKEKKYDYKKRITFGAKRIKNWFNSKIKSIKSKIKRR